MNTLYKIGFFLLFGVSLTGQVPDKILSPVKGTLSDMETGGSTCSSTRTETHWCFNQWGANGCITPFTHCADGGIQDADDTYAWDGNLDNSNGDKDAGKPVYSIADGVIDETVSGWSGTSVGQILIKHTEPNGEIWYSGFNHLHDTDGSDLTTASYTNGQFIKAGEQIGVVGNKGTTNNHLHFAIYEWDSEDSKLVSQDAEIIENSLQINFGQLINFGNAATPTNKRIYFEIPNFLIPTTAPLTSINEIRNVRIGNGDSFSYLKVAKEARFVTGSNSLFYFEIDDLPANVFTNFQFYDIYFDISIGTEYIQAYGHQLVHFVGQGADFSDISNNFQITTYLDINAANGIYEGDGVQYNTPYYFLQNEAVKRGEVAKIICDAAIALGIFDNLATQGNHFVDVPPGHPYFPQIQTLRNKGVIISVDYFNPDNAITYGGICKILIKALFEGTNGINLENITTRIKKFEPYYTNIVCENGGTCDLANYVNQVETGLGLRNYSSRQQIIETFFPEKLSAFSKISSSTSILNIEAEANIQRKDMAVLLSKAYRTVINAQTINTANALRGRNNQNIYENHSIIGSKLNLTAQPTEQNAPELQEFNKTMFSNEKDTLDFDTEVDANGNQLIFYWHSTDGTLEKFYENSFRAVTFEAPVVTEPTLVYLYIWLGNTVGNTANGIFNITVYPEGYTEDPVCNNLKCDGEETCETCPEDCGACPTCYDGIQNGEELGIDCGGPDCQICPTCDDGILNGDEVGVDCGGSNCPSCTGNAITQLEYFLDTDPGIGSGTPVSFNAAYGVEVNFNVNLAGVSPGLHVLYTRVKDQNNWSFPQSHLFMVGTGATSGDKVSNVEYFIDTDPGIGQGTVYNIITPTSDVLAGFDVDLANISPGLHVLYVRVQNESGVWSFPQSHLFMVGTGSTSGDKVSELEYFIDTDPGIGNGTTVNVAAGTEVTVGFGAALANINPGLHVLYVRVKNESGVWSFPQSHLFFVGNGSGTSNEIDYLEYFVNEDPGIGQGTTLPVGQGTEVEGNYIIDLTGLPFGIHVLYLRVRDTKGIWSFAQRRVFLIEPNENNTPKITELEYFIDEEPGIGLAQSILNFAAATDIQTDFIADLEGIGVGGHQLNVRAKDERGIWGLNTIHDFEIFDLQNVSYGCSIEEDKNSRDCVTRYDEACGKLRIPMKFHTGGTTPITSEKIHAFIDLLNLNLSLVGLPLEIFVAEIEDITDPSLKQYVCLADPSCYNENEVSPILSPNDPAFNIKPINQNINVVEALSNADENLIHVFLVDHILYPTTGPVGCNENVAEDCFLLNSIEGVGRFPNSGNYLLIENDNFNRDEYLLFAHELGHSLGLYHTFEEGVFGIENDCTGYDGIGDTAPDPRCDNPVELCNIMDYSDIDNFPSPVNCSLDLLFSDCQEAKMLDILFEVRNNLCVTPEKPILLYQLEGELANLNENLTLNLNCNQFPTLFADLSQNENRSKSENANDKYCVEWSISQDGGNPVFNNLDQLNLNEFLTTTGTYFIEVRDRSTYNELCVSPPTSIMITVVEMDCEEVCEENYTFSLEEELTGGTYHAADYIDFQKTIDFSENITLIAGNRISLLPGTHIQQNSNFVAKIETCQIDVNANNLKKNKSVINKPVLLADKVNQLNLITFPNPFQSQTTIHYHLPKAGKMTLKLSDFLGREIKALARNVEQSKGWHEVQLNATDLQAGTYFLTLNHNGQLKTKKLVLFK